MTTIIKNQIIKHLSKFVRNITADQISVQVLSGKGELKNIELNEIVLSEVLELPTWLRIKRAVCNRIAVKVPWTRLKTLPVQLYIDEIRVEVVLSSEELVESGIKLASSLTESYGYANRVAEGLSMYVNAVEIQFDSGVFRGSLSLSRIAVESKSPGWQPISDLRHSRILDNASSRLLMFKLVTWQLLRIEASVQSDARRNVINAPLRLITSNGKCRITVKKLTTDGTVLGGRIQVILDDILWIATLPQIRSAIAFYDHIMDFVKSSPKKIPPALSFQHCIDAKVPPANKTPTSDVFRNFDFSQTSYHVYVGKIGLHLCDDNQSGEGYPSDWDIPCGALQVTIVQISVDVYPANIAISDRSDWVRYDSENQCATWAHKLLQLHLKNVCSTLDENAQSRLIRVWPQLMSQNCVIRIQDLLVQCVTDMESKKDALFNLFMSDSKSKASMPNQPLVHLEYASFYHPATDAFLLPPNITHLFLGPFFFLYDQRTIRWVLYVVNDIKQAVEASEASFDLDNIPKTCLRVDLLMPKIIMPLDVSQRDHRFPRRIVLSMSTVFATNCETFGDDQGTSFFKSISPKVIDLIDNIDTTVDKRSIKEFVLQLNQCAELLDTDKSERFWISTSPIWIDTDMGEGTLSTPLVADVALHALVAVSAMQVNVAVQPIWKLRAVLDHYQFLQVMRLINSSSRFVDQLTADHKLFTKKVTNGNSAAINLVFFLEQVELNIVLPAGPVPTPYDLCNKVAQLQTPCSESSNEDVGNDISLIPTTKHPQVDQKLPSKQSGFGSFPVFPRQFDSEVASVADETQSITTTVSEEEQLVVFDATEDDIFENDVAIAVEAFVIDEEIAAAPSKKKENKEMARKVSVVTVILDDLNALCSTFNNIGCATGYIMNVRIEQTLDRICGDLYASMNDQMSRAKTENNEAMKESCQEDVVRFSFISPVDEHIPSLDVKVRDLKVTLDDSVVGQLSAFVYDAEKTDLPLHLKVNVSESLFTIKDPQVKTLRIKLKECVIEEGDEVVDG